MTKQETSFRAPERLANWMAGPGWNVSLVVSRKDGEAVDAHALEAAIVAYEKLDTESDGPVFEPPGDDSDEEDGDEDGDE